MGYNPDYGVGSYGARYGAGGVAMKRDEITVSFSIREEDEEEVEAVEVEMEEEEKGGAKRGWPNERRWVGEGDGG